jgi:UDP-N-acetylmuramate--alanine ligase
MKIHFIGIGGIGISALAKYYLANGHEVLGSDLVSSEITEALKKSGAKIAIGPHKPENLPKDAKLIIYSPAVNKFNPELKKAYKIQNTKYKIQILSYPEAIGDLTKQHFTIAVSGTHGKSTTTAMLSLILIKAGLNPTVIIGTKLKEFGDTNFRMGGTPDTKYKIQDTKYLLIEADEHFASFLNYWPKIIVLTNIDADHLDFYKNIGNIIKTFKEYSGHLPTEGFLVLNDDDKNSKKIISAKNKFQIKKFSLKQPEAGEIRKILKIPGKHMVSDALAAMGAARILGVPDAVSLKALSEYNGAWRRFEIIKIKPFTLISDYGHNPVKMLATLEGAREKYPNKKIWCFYQPHQYQRTYFLFKEFVKAFRQAPADNIIITDIYDVAGREEKSIKQEVNSEKLAKAVKKPSVIYMPAEKTVDYLKKNVKNGEVLIIMGAGDIYKLCEKF